VWNFGRSQPKKIVFLLSNQPPVSSATPSDSTPDRGAGYDATASYADNEQERFGCSSIRFYETRTCTAIAWSAARQQPWGYVGINYTVDGKQQKPAGHDLGGRRRIRVLSLIPVWFIVWP
jgi:hypothetical protein